MKLLSALLAILIILPCASQVQGATTIWAVGNNNTILRMDSGNWQSASGVPQSPTCTFRSVWGSLSNDVYVASHYRQLLHYDGTAWQFMTMPGVPPEAEGILFAIDGTGPNNIYAVGGIDGEFLSTGFVYHFDGATWSAISEYPPSLVLTDVWADPAGGAYVIGDAWEHLAQADIYAIYRYHPLLSWAKQTPRQLTNRDAYYHISGYGENLVNVTGLMVSEYPKLDPGGPVIHEMSSNTWYVLGRNVSCSGYSYCPYWPTTWCGTWGSPPKDTWLCGTNGQVLHATQYGYTEFSTPATVTLRAIWGTSNMDVYAVGDAGTIVHYDGNSWNSMASGTTYDLLDVFGTEAAPIATLLQSYSIDAQLSQVAIRWSLSDYDGGTGFRVTRLSPAAPSAPLVNENPALERAALSFTYIDRNVNPGDEYSYRIEYSSTGTWRLLFETETVSVPEASLALKSIYPNPFNPSTTISYSIPERGRATLRIYDAAGTLVRRLLDEEKAAGAYTIQWNGLDDQGQSVASGTYFCRLEAGKTSTSHKMLLMR